MEFIKQRRRRPIEERLAQIRAILNSKGELSVMDAAIALKITPDWARKLMYMLVRMHDFLAWDPDLDGLVIKGRKAG